MVRGLPPIIYPDQLCEECLLKKTIKGEVFKGSKLKNQEPTWAYTCWCMLANQAKLIREKTIISFFSSMI